MSGVRSGRAFTAATTGSTRLTRNEREAIRQKNSSVALYNELKLRFGPKLPPQTLHEIVRRILARQEERLLLFPDGPVKLELVAFELGKELLQSCGIKPSKEALEYAKKLQSAKAQRVRAPASPENSARFSQEAKFSEKRFTSNSPRGVETVENSRLRVCAEIAAAVTAPLRPSFNPSEIGSRKCALCARVISFQKNADLQAHFDAFHPSLSRSMRRVLARKTSGDSKLSRVNR